MSAGACIHTHEYFRFLYVHLKPPLLISCTFSVCVRVKERSFMSLCKASLAYIRIHPKLPHLPCVCRCMCVWGLRVDVHICVCALQHAIKMSNDSCSLFTLQPSFLPLEMCLLLVIEELGLSPLSYIKLLNRGGKRAEIFYSSTINHNFSKCPFLTVSHRWLQVNDTVEKCF